jgi:hypothetical protein
VSAGISFEQVATDEELIRTGGYDIVVATVVTVEDQHATHGMPPKLKLSIEEVLHGGVKTGAMDALWCPPGHDVDWVGDGATERLTQWAATLLKGPRVGSRMILIGNIGEGTVPDHTLQAYPQDWRSNKGKFCVASRCRYPYSDEKRKWVLELLGKATGIAPVQIKIDSDLRLKDGFDYSTYYGVFRSQEGLNEIWKNMINVQKEVFLKKEIVVPLPPRVDFGESIVLWFADRGAQASFVKSMMVLKSDQRNTLTALVEVFHSDFGSSRLNLWRIPRTDKSIVFEVKHLYEER